MRAILIFVMIFSLWEAARRAAVQPEGEAENLVANHQRWVVDALIDLQRKVPCLQVNHDTKVPQCATYYLCGASVFEAPRGFLQKLYTIDASDYGCNKIEYSPISKREMDCLLQNVDTCATIKHPYGFYLDAYDVYQPNPVLPIAGLEFSDSTLDKICRTQTGFWTLHRGNIYLFPSMQWSETAVLEWDGLKRTFSDAEEIDADIYDREVERAVELYLEAEIARKDEENMTEYASALGSYNTKVADLIYNCQMERKLPRPNPCFNNCC